MKHEKNTLKVNRRITDSDFFSVDAEKLAKRLLGKILVRNIDNQEKRFIISETECYTGEFDTACHAHIGKTPRTKVLWEKGGTLYVHLIYGIHYMLNIVAGQENSPMGVLIRGVLGAKGPGLVTKNLQIDKSFNQENLMISSRIWLEDAPDLKKYDRKPRVGINYAQKKDREKLYRFLADNYLK